LMVAQLFNAVTRICDQINLQHQTYYNQVKQLVLKLMKKKWRGGRKAELQVAACCYIVARRNNKPVTLLDVSDAVMESVFKVGIIYRNVVQLLEVDAGEFNLDPALFIERACDNLDLTPSASMEILELSLRLINLAKKDWIVTGRKPTGITAAAILICLESKGIQNKKTCKYCPIP